MNYHDLRGHSSLAVHPAFTIGIEDGINPCGVAAAMVFIMYLSFVGYTRRRVFLLGAIFIVSAVITQVMMLMGYWDRVLTSAIFLLIIKGIYLLWAVIFLILGILNVLDWWRYKKRSTIGCFALKLPVFFRDCAGFRTVSWGLKISTVTGLVFMTIFTGGMVTLMGSIYPQNEYIFIVHSFWMAGGDQGFAYWSFFLYSMAMVLPLVIVWLIVLWMIFKGNKNLRAILYYKGISAALFLSAGIGLGYFFLK